MRNGSAWIVALFLAPSLLTASRLPIKTYTTADGLARDHVLCIEQDSRGFLWFCTPEGLSRFDGYQFTNYRTTQGLPADAVNDFLETRRGVYWVATAGGLAVLDPGASGTARFRRYALPAGRGAATPSVLYEDADGGVWCGVQSSQPALFHLPHDATAFVPVPLWPTDRTVTAVVVDRHGALWAGSGEGLLRRDRAGAERNYTTQDGLPNPFIMALLEDHEGRLWVGTRAGLVRLDVSDGLSGQPRMRVYTKQDGLPGLRIEALRETSDGRLWVCTNEGLAEWLPAERPGGSEFRSYRRAEGLVGRSVGAIAEDRDGNLWIGTFGSGVMKVARGGFTTYTEADGVPQVVSLVNTPRGEICTVHGNPDAGLWVDRYLDGRFASFRPAWPPGISYFGWGSGQIAVEDHGGAWWIATGQGLCRFPPVRRVEQLNGLRPETVYTQRNGLAGDNIFRVFEDSRGDIWIGTIGLGSEDGLALLDRRSGRVRSFSEADGLPPHPVPTAFAEDRSGSVWASLYHGGLARYQHGRFAVFGGSDGVAGFVRTLFVDSAGRLWIGTSLGLLRVEDAAADRPRFIAYTAAQGLSSSDVAAISEDRFGRLYAATGRGIDRFEPQPGGLGRIRHYTTADGVAPGELQLALADREGALWFSTPLGLSRLSPTPDRLRAPPVVLVTGLAVGDVPQALSELGQTAVSGLRFHPSPLRIDFVGLDFAPGESLHYQYRLDGADRDWNAPTDQRAVVYASLSPGEYRFLVRAVASEGTVSREPASVSFTVLPPFWRTGWFVMACVGAGLLILYVLYRYRLAQLLAVANLRTRIATDLHDDIGASLSQIAILSEVAQRPVDPSAPRELSPLSEIAEISRELVDSMGDIVWAINPEHDRLGNLVHRMRRFATDLLGGQDIRLRFVSSVGGEDLRIGANVRRQVYLIFKEAVHNIARHSGASEVSVELEAEGSLLRLRIADNGRGFDASAPHEGHGLASMRRRAAAVLGQVAWDSAPGRGAALTLTLHLPRGGALSVLRGKMMSLFR